MIFETALKYAFGLVTVFQILYDDLIGNSERFEKNEFKELKGKIVEVRKGNIPDF